MATHTIEEILPLLDSNEKEALTDIAEIIIKSKNEKKLRKEIELRRKEIKDKKIIKHEEVEIDNEFIIYFTQLSKEL